METYNFNPEDCENLFRYLDNQIICNDKVLNMSKGISLPIYDDFKDFDNSISYVQKHLYDNYSHHCWYHKEKETSYIMGKLLRHKKFFERNKVTIDQVVTIIRCLVNYSNYNNIYETLPDRLLVKRSHTSLEKLTQVIYMLCQIMPNIFSMKRQQFNTLIKVNRKQLKADNYIGKVAKVQYNRDKYYKIAMSQDDGRVCFYPYSYTTIKKHWKFMILGISYWYTKMVFDYITPKERLEDIEKYGKRLDIDYMEMPIHIISRALGVSSKKIMSYINAWCGGCTYMKRHKQVYVNGKGPFDNHYYREDYDIFCKREDYRKAKEEKGRPIVTPFSCILFMDNIKETKVFKKVLENEDLFKDNIKREIYFNYLNELYNQNKDNYYKDAFVFNKQEIDEITEIEKNKIDFNTLQEEIRDMIGGDKESRWGSLVSRSKLNKIYPTTEARKVKKILERDLKDKTGRFKYAGILCLYLYKVKEFMGSEICKDFNREIKMYNILKEQITEQVEKFKTTNIKVYKDLLYKIRKYNLEYDLNIYI